ncbi:MAG TPA: ADOP family duplicated permease, partial [Longimicrobiales bacterium]|nr:ADOP family duplicated permease [Longimicrobiales bacterium]
MPARVLLLAYRLALRLLPVAFRLRWRSELLAVVNERVRKDGMRGGLRELFDLVLTGARLRRQAMTISSTTMEDSMQAFHGVALDLKSVARSLRRQPGYTLAAVCTLAVGVGASTTLFGIFDQVVVQPLPHEHGNRLYMVWRSLPEYDIERASNSYPTYLDVRDGIGAFDATGAYAMNAAATIAAGGEPERIRGARVSGTVFALLGNEPAHGRTVGTADDDPGAERVVVLSHALWQRQYGGSGDVIGTSLRIGDVPHRIIGVMPAGFAFPSPEAEFWLPLRLSAAATERDLHNLSIIARLAPEIPPDLANAQLAALHTRLQAAYPGVYAGGMWLERRQDFIVGDAAGVLRALLWAALFLAGAATANFAGMLLVRAAARRRETAVALALGAGRLRSARPLVIESLMLSLSGCAAGVVLAAGLISAVQQLAPDSLPRRGELGLDLRSLLFASGLAIVAGIACALLAGWRLSRQVNTGGVAAAAARFADRASRRTQSALVVGQIAVAFLLLTAATLFATSLIRLLNVPVGFDRDRVLTAYVSLPPTTYDSPERIGLFFDGVFASLRAAPGVTHAGGTWALPFSEDYASTTFTADLGLENGVAVSATAVRGDYFDAVGMRVLRGRPFDSRDAAGAHPAVIINETMAQRLFGDVDPIGRPIRKPDAATASTVVGVVSDVRRRELTSDVEPEIYYPHAQSTWSGDFYVVLRTAGNAAALSSVLRGAIRDQDPTLPVMRLATLGERVSRSVATPRFRTFVLGALAAAACVLAFLGIYGSLSYLIVSTRRDTALRVAVGADPRRLVRSV